MTRELAILHMILRRQELESSVGELDEDIKAFDIAINSIVAWGSVKTEIKEWYRQVDKQALAKDPCVVDEMVDMFIRTIDNHLKEVEE